jgi:uncharacterized membrane protein YfcA
LNLSSAQVGSVAGIGLAAGLLGGLAGIGGSLVMIPALGLTLGFSDGRRQEQHLYMAAAMVVNVVVAASATRQHARRGAIDRTLVVGILPWLAGFNVIGVLLSNLFDGRSLKLALAGFIAFYCVYQLVLLFRRIPDFSREQERGTPKNLAFIGAGAGLVAGLLGLGGGVLMVPMLQLLARLGIRRAVACSAAAMSISAVFASIAKLSSLPSLGLSVWDAITIAAVMTPGALIGAPIGARLAHVLPLPAVRASVSVLLLIAAARVAGLL